MRVLLFGSNGHIGTAVAMELLNREHEVTGATRSGINSLGPHQNLTPATGDACDASVVAALAPGHDVVASAIGPRIGEENDREIIVGATKGLIDGLRKSDVRRLVALGGAGSLLTADGTLLIESPHFPVMWKANAQAQAEALALYREVTDVDWTYISPAAQIEPGPRRGTYRVGSDELLVDTEGNSRISIADFAIAFVDEIESGASKRRRICVAY